MINISVRSVMFLALLIFACDICADEPDYFYFECTEGTPTIKLNKTKGAPTVNLKYSTDGINWMPLSSQGISLNMTSQNKVYINANKKNSTFASTNSNYN